MATERARSRRFVQWLAAGLACLALTSCGEQNWKWDWWNKDSGQPKQRPVTKTTTPRPADESKTVKTQPAPATPAPENANAQDKELQEKVDRYVQAMAASTDGPRPGYNDFNAKMQRQQDPNRQSRVRRVAERGDSQQEPSGPHASDAARPAAEADSVKPATTASPEPRRIEPTITAQSPRTEQPEQNARPVKIASEPAAEETRTPSAPVQQPPRPIDTRPAAPREDRAMTEPAQPVFEAESVGAEESTPRPVSMGPPSRESGETAEGTSGPHANLAEIGSAAAAETGKPARPPVLEEVTVSAGPESTAEWPAPAAAVKAEAAGTPAEGARPTPNIAAAPAEAVDTFQRRLTEQEAKSAKEPQNLTELYRLRLMYLVDGQDDKALAPAEGLDAESQRILQAQLRALVTARTASRDPASWATDLLSPVEELRDHLRARADLQVPKVILCTKIDAFGLYEPIDPARFPAGQKNPVLVYIEVDNFRSEKTPSGLFRTLLSVRPSLLNKAGEELWSANYDNIEDLSRQQRHDFFLTVNEVLPASLAPGEYTLKIEVEDILAGKINSNTAKFKIAAAVEPASPKR